MSRIPFSEEPTELGATTLDELIPQYGENKSELDSYKKICEAENAKIKDLMLASGTSEYRTSGWVAKRTVVEKESINEERLLVILKRHNLESVIETRECVNMDALESYLYNHEVSNDLATDLASCKDKKTEVRITVSREKKKRKEEE